MIRHDFAPGLQHRVRHAHPLRPLMRRSLQHLESASADDIIRFQERRLRALVLLAAHRSPYYRDWFARTGTDPRDIRVLADLQRLPLLERADLVDAPERFRTYPAATMWPARSTGTTGQAVTTYRTPGSSVYEMAVLARQWGWFRVPKNPRSLILRGDAIAAGRPGAVTEAVPGANALRASSFHLESERFPDLMATLLGFAPQIVEGWPSSIDLLAQLLLDHGRTLPVAAVVTSSEVLPSERRARIAAAFEAPIVDHYGQTERVCMAGGCEAGGYHVFPDYGIVELLPVPGSNGSYEIIGTPLHNWGFPLFRYRTGDEVGPAPEQPCACGRAFTRLGVVRGRVEEMFTAADGRSLPLPSIVLDDLPGLRRSQIAQRAPGRFEIRFVPGPGYEPFGLRAHALRNIDRHFGHGQHVEFREYSRIPTPPTGKFRPAIVEGALPPSGPQMPAPPDPSHARHR